MSNWNSGNGSNFNWQAPPFYPSQQQQQQQYVGFNDFINQYQLYGNEYQNPHNNHPNSTQNGSYNSSYNSNNTGLYTQNSFASQQNAQNRHRPSSQEVPWSQDNNLANFNNKQTSSNISNYNRVPRVDEPKEMASTSTLTATAQEFVPQSLRSQTTVEDAPSSSQSIDDVNETISSMTISNQSNNRNNGTSGGNKFGNRGKYNESNGKSSYNNRRNDYKQKYSNTNWRSRDDSEQGTSVEHTIVVNNSNNVENVEDNRRYNRSGNGSRDRQKDRNTNSERNSAHSREYNSRSSNYNNKYGNRDNYRNNRGYDNSDNVNNDYDEHNDNVRSVNRNSYNNSRSKNSYSVNESFKQRDGEGSRDRGEGQSRNYKKNKNGEDGPKYTERSPIKDNANIGQRERLVDQLNRGNLECLVCCDRVRQQDSVWSCAGCYHVLHLACVKKWASSSLQDGFWRCPACQNQLAEIPSTYRCFCGAQRNPEWRRGAADTAHSCGEICNRTRSCAVHPCAIPCHPGPCPVCEAIVQKRCECGDTQQLLKCSHKAALLCGNTCGKTLECGVHTCKDKCHAEGCKPCDQVVEQSCYCPRASDRSVPCDSSSAGVSGYSCGEVCGRVRECGNHPCPDVCHPGPCAQCPLSPDLVTHCPCGQTRLENKRQSCLDPIPTCSKSCHLPLGCGPSDALHTCPSDCHQPPCPPCLMRTPISCRCGHITKEVPCTQLKEMKDAVRCGRKCTKKQSCGRHKCKESCCIDSEHKCPLPCTRTLSCGLHRCEDTCHRGHCQPCWRVSFEELRCRCGASVRYPPVECGARPPSCSQPCTVVRECGHPPHHTCHPSHTHCPPCTVLTQQYCHGRHKLRKTIPCHQQEFSCGLPCGKDMPCGKHKCVESCHKGDCPAVCTQVCNTERQSCGHPCGGKCGHPAPCPSSSSCKAPVTAKCPCGRRTEGRPCHEQTAAQRKLHVLLGPLGEPVDISELVKRGSNDVTLECDLECQTEDRNRRLAIGLQIRNPDLSSKLAPKYSDYLKQMCARDENFATNVHEQLRQLVTLSKESKQRTRSHSFQPMGRPKRQFVHELCQHFGCESVSYDSEPYRNIVVTAYKEKSWLPAMSLMEVVRRDKGQRKVPPPVLSSNSASKTNAWATLGSSNSTTSSTPSVSVSNAVEAPRKPRIDYFDMPPED